MSFSRKKCLNTIYLYIILKRYIWRCCKCWCLNTIYLYIILKHINGVFLALGVWIPYIFTSFSNHNTDTSLRSAFEYHISLHHSQTAYPASAGKEVWIPYIFTSFSNTILMGMCRKIVWIPYIFTSFSNLTNHISYLIIVWIPYIFTSFSNLKFKNDMPSSA